MSTRTYQNQIILLVKTNLHCKTNFEIDGKIILSRKRVRRILVNVKVDIDFWVLMIQVIKLVEWGQRRTTQNNIKKVNGNFDGAILTSMSSQNNNTVFIDKTQKERKELLSQLD